MRFLQGETRKKKKERELSSEKNNLTREVGPTSGDPEKSPMTWDGLQKRHRKKSNSGLPEVISYYSKNGKKKV